jgi:hypothetical protein
MNPDQDFPAEIVRPPVRFGKKAAEARARCRDDSLTVHEYGVLRRCAQPAPVLPEVVLQLVTSGLENNARPVAAGCARGQQRRGVQSHRRRQVQRRLGTIGLSGGGITAWRVVRAGVRPTSRSASRHISRPLTV